MECIGLDIGTSKIKIVELVKKPTVFALKKLAVVPIPFGTIEGGNILQPQVVTEAIKTAIKKSGISGKKVIAAVAGQSVIVRHIKVPNLSDNELRSGLKYEVEKYLPYPVEEAVIDFHVINRPANPSEDMDIMIVAVREAIIHSHVTAITNAGLTPLAIDIQPFALLRSLGFEELSSKQEEIISGKSIALIDIGAGTTDLVIFKDGLLKFTRIIPVAGYRFTTAIAKNLNISEAEAEKKKAEEAVIILGDGPSAGDQNSQEYRLFMSFRGVLEELLLEIKRSFDYYKLQNRGEEVNEVINTGGGSKFRNLSRYMENELMIKTKIGDPLDFLDVSAKHLDYDYLQEIAPMLSVSIGLAQRGAER